MATLYSDETVARAHELKASGASTSAIAKELGACPDTIRNWIKGKRGTVAKKRVVFTAAEILEIRHQRAVIGVGQYELACRFGTSQGVIGRITRGNAYQNVGGYILAPKARDLSRKLSDADVRTIRRLRAEGHSAVRLARRFKVSKALVFGIVAGTLRSAVQP